MTMTVAVIGLREALVGLSALPARVFGPLTAQMLCFVPVQRPKNDLQGRRKGEIGPFWGPKGPFSSLSDRRSPYNRLRGL